MSTHRRGARPSQWPVRDLLGPENGRPRFWDARVGAAAAGLLACGAAVTVVLQLGQPGGVGPAARGSRFAADNPGPSATRSGRSAAFRSAAGCATARCRAATPRTRDCTAPAQRAATAPPRCTASPHGGTRSVGARRSRGGRCRAAGPDPRRADRDGHRRVGGPDGAGRDGRRLAPRTGPAAGGCGSAAGRHVCRRALPRTGLRRSAPGPGSRRRAACRPAPRGPWRPAPRAGPAPRGSWRPASRAGAGRSAVDAVPVRDGRRGRTGRGRPGRAGMGRGPSRACRSPRVGSDRARRRSGLRGLVVRRRSAEPGFRCA